MSDANDKELSWREDWRIMGQEGYLLRQKLQHRRFDRSICFEDYDQCEFCWEVFDEDPSNPLRCYYSPEKRVWVCEECFNDFNPYFCWQVEELADK